jgi:Ran GTPase-activating protein (RanGAP) involved in mRNA processing and transport
LKVSIDILTKGVRMWNKPEEIQKVIDELREGKDNITGIELSSNSLGYDVAKALSDEIKNIANLTHVNYRDIFVSRLKTDLPKSLFELVTAIDGKNITILDLSDSESLANAILSNDDLKLDILSINRNRLEDKGGKAFSK